MPASDLTLPETAAAELGVAEDDARLPRLITVASRAITRALNRKQLHYDPEFAETLPGFGTQRLTLALTPVIAVTEVLHNGAEVDASSYSIEDGGESGLLFRADGWAWTGRTRGGLPPQLDRDAGSEQPLYAVTYEGGWVTPAQVEEDDELERSLPEELEEACIRVVATLYNSGGDSENVESEQLGAYSVKYRDGAGLITPTIQQLIAPYVRVVV